MHACMYTRMNGLCGKVDKRVCVVKRQISYRTFKQTSHFQMSDVNIGDVVSIKKGLTFYLWNTTQLQLER